MAATGMPAAHSISPFCIHSAVLITKLHTGFSIPSGRSNQSSPVLMMTNEVSITIGLISSAISGMLPKLYAAEHDAAQDAVRDFTQAFAIAVKPRVEEQDRQHGDE